MMKFPFAKKSLGDATAQDIQLELLRRTPKEIIDGEKIVGSLLANRELWESVIYDRIHINGPPGLKPSGLIPLRDLPHNIWNADTVYILVANAKAAKKLAKVIKDEEWGGELCVFTEQEEVDSALGSGREERAVIRVWWD